MAVLSVESAVALTYVVGYLHVRVFARSRWNAAGFVGSRALGYLARQKGCPAMPRKPKSSVVRSGNSVRTQKGHIRNDTRDVL